MNALKATLLCSTLFTLSSYCSQITIRKAEQNDLPVINKLDHKVMFEHFKPTIIAGYAAFPIAQDEQLLDSFLNEYIALRKASFSQAINKTDNANLNLCVASDSQKTEKIRGLCVYEKKDKQLYIHHIVVAQKFRGQGIGTLLLTHAIATHNDITSCELDTLAYANEKVHHFYEKYGFTSTKELVTIDPRTPNTHIRYCLDLKK